MKEGSKTVFIHSQHDPVYRNAFAGIYQNQKHPTRINVFSKVVGYRIDREKKRNQIWFFEKILKMQYLRFTKKKVRKH